MGVASHETYCDETSVHDLELVLGGIYPPLRSKLVRVFAINVFVHMDDGGIDADVGSFGEPVPADHGAALGHKPFQRKCDPRV